MSKDMHFGLVVGIDHYPEFKSLAAARGDAVRFAEWLENPAGGDLPKGNVSRILGHANKKGQLTTDQGKPVEDEVVNAFDDFCQRVEDATAARPAAWAESRLYVFLAGHGIAPKANDAALLMGNSDRRKLSRNVPCSTLRDWLADAQIFKEVLLFADCCRVRERDAKPSHLGLTTKRGNNGPVLSVVGCATYFGDLAWEEDDGEPDQRRGYFTRALLDGLGGEAANDQGAVTSNSLGEFVRRRVESLTNGRRKKQTPTFDSDPGNPIEICRVPAPVKPVREVRVIFPGGFGGGAKVVQGAAVIHQTAAAPGRWVVNLTDGIYEVKPGAPGFAFANDGLFKVDGEDRDVQL